MYNTIHAPLITLQTPYKQPIYTPYQRQGRCDNRVGVLGRYTGYSYGRNERSDAGAGGGAGGVRNEGSVGGCSVVCVSVCVCVCDVGY